MRRRPTSLCRDGVWMAISQSASVPRSWGSAYSRVWGALQDVFSKQSIAIVEVYEYVCTGSIMETRDIFAANFLALAYQQRVVHKIWWESGIQQDQSQTQKRIEPRPFVRLMWSRIFKHGWSEALQNRHENCRNKRMFRAGLVNVCCSFYRWSPIEWHVSKNWSRKTRQNVRIIARGFFIQLWVVCGRRDRRIYPLATFICGTIWREKCMQIIQKSWKTWRKIFGLKFGELTPLSRIACMTICCSVHKSALTYKEIIFSTFSNQ